MRQVNRYIIPETRGNVTTKAGAIKRAKQVYAANKELIDQRLTESAKMKGARLPSNLENVFIDSVLGNLHSDFGGYQEDDYFWTSKGKVKAKLKINEALEKTLNNAEMTPYKDRARMNMLATIKMADPDGMRALRKIMKRQLTYEDLDYLEDSGDYQIDVGGGRFWLITTVSQSGKTPEWRIINPDLM